MRIADDPYANLAELYDSEMDSTVRALYREWREKLMRAIDEHGVKVRRLVDVACGTGNTAIPWLKKRGWSITGIDSSRAMLAQAKKKSRRVKWLLQDMRKLKLAEQANVVTCHFDAMNHLLSARDMARALKSIAGIMEEGGLFQFDMNTWQWFEWLAGREKLFRVGEDCFISYNSYKPKERIATFNQLWFVKSGRRYERRLVTVRERAYSVSEVKRALMAAGLELLEAGVQRELDGKPIRILYLARKRRP